MEVVRDAHNRECDMAIGVKQDCALITGVNFEELIKKRRLQVETLGQRVAAIRGLLGLSQVALASAAGVSAGTIGNLEAGTRKNPRSIWNIALALQVSPHWLQHGTGTVETLDEDSQAPATRNAVERYQVQAVVESLAVILDAVPDAQRDAIARRLSALALAPDSEVLVSGLVRSLKAASSGSPKE